MRYMLVAAAAVLAVNTTAFAAGAANTYVVSGYSAAASTTDPVGSYSSGGSTTDPVGSSAGVPGHLTYGVVATYGSNGGSSDDDSSSDDDTSGGPPPPAGDQAIVALKVERVSGQRTDGRMVTFGQVFKQGDVPDGRSVTAEVGGRAIPTQVDPKATWDDGSLRHAVITIRLPDAPGASGTTVQLVKTQASDRSKSALTIGDLLATDFAGRVSIRGQGGRRQTNARRLLREVAQSGGCARWSRECKHWLSGPLVSEWIVGGPVAGGHGSGTPNLAVYFNIRAYAGPNGGIERARVDTVVENDWAYVADPRNLHYTADIKVGGQHYRVPGLTHYRQARWHHVLWWHGDPGLYARIDTDYLQATKAISEYADIAPDTGFLNSRPQQFPPMSNGNQTAYMGDAGAQAAIGPLPRWSSTFAVSGNYHAFRWMLANDSAVGSYSFHYRDRETGRPLTITRHPYVTIADYNHASRAGGRFARDLLPDCHGDCSSPYTYNIAHQPSIGYLAYLVTGDFYYLEEMQFAAAYDELWANPSYREHARGILRGAQGQVRAQAWALRDISDAAFATPDRDPMKPYFQGLIKNILSDYNDYYVGTGVNPLHTLVGNQAIRYPSHGREKVAIAPWQADFFTWAVGHAAEQGMPGAESFLSWLAPFQIQRMTGWIGKPDSGFCWLEASTYTLQLRDSRNSPIYSDMSEVYQANFPRLVGLDCNSPSMVRRIGSDKLGEMVGFPSSPAGFPANFQIGLAMAVESGADQAGKAWQLFENRQSQPDYSNYPNFAVVPRNQ
ncbi:hypothetical protein [Salinisphaera sp.]|uniref:RIFT barrel domain-containing protein n=1 Tax=Salinisphaera sp. TaxID=1914330 RepID=UPI002D79350E|nr:hypothetical protein [Salinisphaera sp.]HET7315394.1 hypothetical protein [Salinisphaera sp.]